MLRMVEGKKVTHTTMMEMRDTRTKWKSSNEMDGIHNQALNQA